MTARRRRTPGDAGEPPAPSIPGDHRADTQVIGRQLEAGPPVLMCAVAHAAAAGTGPDAAARLAAVLVFMDLELAVLWETGRLREIDTAAAELRAARCPRCGIHQTRHDTAALGHTWMPPGGAGPVGTFRRRAAALLLGRGPAPDLPGSERIPVADLYERARAPA